MIRYKRETTNSTSNYTDVVYKRTILVRYVRDRYLRVSAQGVCTQISIAISTLHNSAARPIPAPAGTERRDSHLTPPAAQSVDYFAIENK